MKEVICDCPEEMGLGNRIKNLFSVLRQYQPHKVDLIWPATGWVTARFQDLFILNYPVEIKEYLS